MNQSLIYSWYEQYKNGIFRYALSITKDPYLAEDVLHVLDSFTYRGLIYESAKYHNVVFVGKDKDGKPRHAHKRGSGSQSTYKSNAPGSLPGYSFHWVGASDRLYLFEAPVDLLSYISMHRLQPDQPHGRIFCAD